MQGDIKTSIIVRAYNEDQHIDRLLAGIRQQKTSFQYETILVDSGSTDKTLQIAAAYDIKTVHIKPDEFSFGYSLNKGIAASEGEFCVMISAHCYPDNNTWLENLIAPFTDKSVALIYGKQRGNEITRYTEEQILKKWFPDSEGGIQKTSFCNNANAAIRKRVWEKYHYNEILTGLEDLEWAKNAQRGGYNIYYEPSATVIHVHDETYAQIYRRYEREAIAMKAIYAEEFLAFAEFIKLTVLNIANDIKHARREKKLIGNLFDIVAMRFLQFLGAYAGFNYKKPVSSELKHKFYYPRKH